MLRPPAALRILVVALAAMTTGARLLLVSVRPGLAAEW